MKCLELTNLQQLVLTSLVNYGAGRAKQLRVNNDDVLYGVRSTGTAMRREGEEEKGGAGENIKKELEIPFKSSWGLTYHTAGETTGWRNTAWSHRPPKSPDGESEPEL